MAQAGVEFARANTQEIWLHARAQWTLALVGAPGRDRARAPVPEQLET
jgi:hypothetical protein